MVRTRFAPSPTGSPESVHLGFVIRALWNYAFAKKNAGQFILRIEDTDTKRSRQDTEEAIYSTLQSFGIKWDEGPDIGGPFGPYKQSQRLEKYQSAAHELVQKGFAYYDFDAQVREKEEIKQSYLAAKPGIVRPKARFADPEESRRRVEAGEKFVVRVKIPEDRTFEYEDWILRKKIRMEGKEVADLIILKSDGYPTYHLAVVVDDIDMKISHVFRGQEWISTTPIHLFLYEGLGSPVPQIGHFSVILDPRTGKKFSKRDMSAMFGVNNWVNQGYLREAVLNYLMLLGWAPKDNREMFTLEEFVEVFDQEGIQKANPVFDVKKLDWFNGQYIRQKSDSELINLFKPYLPNGANSELLNQITPLIKERIVKLSDINSFAGFFFTAPQVDVHLFGPNSKQHLAVAVSTLKQIEVFDKPSLDSALMQCIADNNFKTGDFFMSLRIAITGSKFTPPINESMVVLGKSEVVQRIDLAYQKLST